VPLAVPVQDQNWRQAAMHWRSQWHPISSLTCTPHPGPLPRFIVIDESGRIAGEREEEFTSRSC
jgi:hypothetical protein